MIDTSPHHTINSSQLVGWVPDPEGRGTAELLISSLSTIFLCTWVIIHPRIDGSPKTRLLHKIALFTKTVFGPELIAVEAAQEWTQARRIQKRFRKAVDESKHGKEDFQLLHAFYLGMFGVRYRVASERLADPSSGTKVLWPLQYDWLLQHGYIFWTPSHREQYGLEEDVIDDKSNADAIAKLIALVGVGKFVVESILRVSHGLPLAPIESMTLAYIPLFALTYFFWWLKPKDIQTPAVVDLPNMELCARKEFDRLSPTDDFDHEGKPSQNTLLGVWRLTPRDFELDLFRNDRPSVSTKYGQGAVLANWDPDFYDSPILWPLTCVFGISFGALHLICWDTVFPTVQELWLWRCSAIVSMATMLVFMQFKQVILQWSQWRSWITIVAGSLYILSRVVAVVEAFTSLRGSAPDIYRT